MGQDFYCMLNEQKRKYQIYTTNDDLIATCETYYVASQLTMILNSAAELGRDLGELL